MCRVDELGEILIFILDNGDIIKWAIHKTDHNLHSIPSVPITPSTPKYKKYESLCVSPSADSILVSLRDRAHENMNEIWIFEQSVGKWFNTQYRSEMDDGFRSFKYHEDSWFALEIGADTQMSYEVNLSLHRLSVHLDDEISECSNEEISVSADCLLTIDVSKYSQFLSNKIHRIHWDLTHKLMVLLFDEFLIWISIESDLVDPKYVVSLIPQSQRIKFRDVTLIDHGMMAAVITNRGSLVLYQRYSDTPIPINHRDDNQNQQILSMEWKGHFKSVWP